MLISLWQIIITAFGNAVEDLSLFPGFPFHRCRQQKKKILSEHMSTFFQNTVVQYSNLCQPSTQLVAAAANALENCLSLFSSVCNELKLNDRNTILPWGWQEANSYLVFIFAPGHSGYYRVWRLVTFSCVSSFFQKRRPRRGRKDALRKRLPS